MPGDEEDGEDDGGLIDIDGKGDEDGEEGKILSFKSCVLIVTTALFFKERRMTWQKNMKEGWKF